MHPITRRDVKAALPATAEPLGLVDGRFAYAVPTAHPQVRIMVRAGAATEAGATTIQLTVQVHAGDWRAVDGSPAAEVAVTENWATCLAEKLDRVTRKAALIRQAILPGDRVSFATPAAPGGRPFATNGGAWRCWLV